MFKNENRHYSLRKLSVGLASVLIGISFASSMGSNSVKADTVNSGSNSGQIVIKGNDIATKIDAKDDTNVAASNTESALEASKKDSNAITQDIKQKAIKASCNNQ